MLIYANLRHGVQMFSQISRVPNLIKNFEQKGAAYMPVFTVNCSFEQALHVFCILDFHFLNPGKKPADRTFAQKTGPRFGLELLNLTVGNMQIL